ncbi:MAG: hypothetical protein JNM24_02430 [Bdellovibrionaceae bacterium]|nr:hypothetical protein [Pseudobdellovibrionaceae bacterium]
MFKKIGNIFNSIYFWGKAEKGIIIWTSILGLVIGIIYALAGPKEFPSVDWFGRMASGMTAFAILSSVANRYVIAAGREKSGKLTANILDLVSKSEAVLTKREEMLEQDRKIFEFERFLKKEAYHNVRFPNLKPNNNSLGLEYTIKPVREMGTNESIKLETEMWSAYVVFVEEPAHIEVLSEEQLKDYDGSPIKSGEDGIV